MSNHKIIAVGKQKKSPELEIFNEYKKRLNNKISIVEVDSVVDKNIDIIKKKEAKNIIEKIDKDAFLIVLDEHGKNLSSVEFANKIENITLNGFNNINYIIGGAYGIDPQLIAKANLKICLGNMTWPHMMVRFLIAEQIYRANKILVKHPYHKV